MMFLTLTIVGCGEKEQLDLFDYDSPVDLSEIRQAYNWYQTYEGEGKDSILYTMILPDLPDYDFYLSKNTSFVLFLPEYLHSTHQFLAKAEDFYNSNVFAWNVWSNYEIWYRGHTADLLCNDADVKESTMSLSAEVIQNEELRQAAQNYKDSILMLMNLPPKRWQDNVGVTDFLFSFTDAIENARYKFYEDKDSFACSWDSVINIAEGLARDKFQHYLDASEDEQLEVILTELSNCSTFDEQSALWRKWSNCARSVMEDEWIVAVGSAMMQGHHYSPLLTHIWITWRALCQETFYGMSRDSSIPNDYYNKYRRICYQACLKRIEHHPDDIYAMYCATCIGGQVNLNRFGQNYYGNEAMVEAAMMLPERYFGEDEVDDEGDDFDDSVVSY